jgi:succinate-acetate transporter protein
MLHASVFPLLQAGIFEPSHDGEKMMLSLWGILTFLFFVGSLSLNLALQALFLLLSVVFFLLAGGVHNPYSHKVRCWLSWPQFTSLLTAAQNALSQGKPQSSKQYIVSTQAAGWIGLVVSAIAFYAGAADLINERYQKVRCSGFVGQSGPSLHMSQLNSCLSFCWCRFCCPWA